MKKEFHDDHDSEHPCTGYSLDWFFWVLEKTTLLNHILTAEHGKRIAVIENEFGEVGVDQDFGDRSRRRNLWDEQWLYLLHRYVVTLIRILGNLMKRRDKFDYILVETTGMADPGPVAQTFFRRWWDAGQAENWMALSPLSMPRHVWEHIDTSDEVKEQIAFADVILLQQDWSGLTARSHLA